MKTKIRNGYKDLEKAIRSFMEDEVDYTCVRHSLEAGETIDPHTHSEVDEWIVTHTGNLNITLEQFEYDINLQSGWAVTYIPKGQKHSLIANTKVSYFVFRNGKSN